MKFEVQILGSNSALPAHGRHPSAQIVSIRNRVFLVDCGEGTQMQMVHYSIKPFKIDHVFISHLHGDHYFGLIGIITSYHLLGREKPLNIYGPKELKSIIELQLAAGGNSVSLNYNLIFHFTDNTGVNRIYEDDNMEVYSFPLKHRIPTTGFLFKEKQDGRRINKEVLQNLELELNSDHYKKLKNGEDIDVNGRSFANNDLTIDPYKPRSYAYCSDTIYDEELVPIIKEIDLLYHESTFQHNALERAKQTYHSTSSQAATIAQMANVRELIIGHFSSKYYDLNELLNEAQEIFPNTSLALEGFTFEVERRT